MPLRRGGGERGLGRSHAVPNMATDTSVTAAILERVLGECMEHLQHGGALEHGPRAAAYQ